MSSLPAAADPRPRILIVDDELHNRDLLEVMLGAEGYVILTAAGGKEAVALARQQPPPDLILLDIMMPGMTGFHVVAELKANVASRDIPVILITALDDLKANMSRLSTGAEDLITKPVNRVELCTRVRTLLNLKVTRDDDQ